MAIWMLILSFLVSRFAIAKRRALSEHEREKSARGSFYRHLLQWSVSLFAVLLFYHVLLFGLSVGWAWLSIETLELIEARLDSLNRFVEDHRLTWVTWIVLYAVIYLLSRVWIRFLLADTPFKLLKKVRDGLETFATIAFLLASLTLLGFDAGAPSTTLKIHLRKEREDYGVLRGEMHDAAVAMMLARTVDRLNSEGPPSHNLPRLLESSQNDGARLRRLYQATHRRSGISDPTIESLLRRIDQQRTLYEGSAKVSTLATNSRSDVVEPPGFLTYHALEISTRRWNEVRDRLKPKMLRLLRQPGGKEIVLELPNGVVDHLAEVFDPLVDAYPALKPLFEIARSTVSDALDAKFESKIEALLLSTPSDPRGLEANMRSAAYDAVDSRVSSVRATNASRVEKSLQHFRRQLTAVRRSISVLDHSRQLADRNPLNEVKPQRSARQPLLPAKPSPSPSPDGGSRDNVGQTTPRAGGGATSKESGGIGDGSAVVSCICKHYVNGMLVGSFPIPVGASCGGQVCGGRRPRIP